MTRKMGEPHEEIIPTRYAITQGAVTVGDFIQRRGHNVNPGPWLKVTALDGMTITAVNEAGYSRTWTMNTWDLFYLHPYSYKHNRPEAQ